MTSFANVGDVIAAKYRVDKIIAIGGMGMIVAATHLELGQRVALKFMLPEGLTSPNAMTRFMREAQAAVRLRGDHVCRVHDVGRLENGAPYIVMELMSGTDLSKLIRRRGPLPVGEAIDLVLQALEGVAEAHANGIIHRDLKPGNLFVTVDDDDAPFVKVLDFGISKSAFGGDATQTGDVLGSPAYMSPEQMLSSKNVDVRADVWAIGVITYYAVSGRLPFEGDTLPTLCMRVMNDAPRPLDEVRADLPDGFAAVVMRCLEKPPASRYDNVEDLARALAPFGTRDPATITRRIGKVLRRIPAEPAIAIPPLDRAGAPVTVAPPTVAMLPSALADENTTFQSSAAEVSIHIAPVPTEQRRKRKWATLGAVGVTGIVTTIAVMVASTDRAPNAKLELPTPASAPAVSAPPPPTSPPATWPTVSTTPITEPPSKPAPKAKVTRKLGPASPRPAPAAEVKPPEAKPESKPPEPVPEPAKPPGSKWTHMQHDGKPQ